MQGLMDMRPGPLVDGVAARDCPAAPEAAGHPMGPVE
jgi:hypothetical protein